MTFLGIVTACILMHFWCKPDALGRMIAEFEWAYRVHCVEIERRERAKARQA